MPVDDKDVIEEVIQLRIGRSHGAAVIDSLGANRRLRHLVVGWEIDLV